MSPHSNGVIDPQLDSKPVYIEHAGASHARGKDGRFGTYPLFAVTTIAGQGPRRIIRTNAPAAPCNLVEKKPKRSAPGWVPSLGLIALYAKKAALAIVAAYIIVARK